MRTQFTDVSKIAQGLVLNNYNSIFSGDNEIQNAISHSFNLNYFSFNLFNYTNIFARISYNKSIDQIRNLFKLYIFIKGNCDFFTFKKSSFIF